MRQNPYVLLVPFGLASVAALALSTHIYLPFSNPWNIAGELALVHFNPANNTLRFLLFVCAPVLLLALLRGLPFSRDLYSSSETPAGTHSPTCRKTAGKLFSPLGIMSCLFCVIIALNSSTYHDSDPSLDTFHEGESLGASISLLNGGIPYQDVVFSPGVLLNPLRSVIAFNVFTRSIGAARTLDSILALLTFVALFAFLVLLYKGRYLWVDLTLFAVSVLLYCRWLFIISRDLITFAFLLVVAVLACVLKDPEPRLSRVSSTALVLFSFFPLAAMMYSVDRGFYLTATYFVMLPMVVFYFRRRSLYRVLLLSALGFGLAVLLAGIVLHWEFRPFIDFSIITVPRYWELMDGFVYPFQSPRYLLIVLMISWNVYWIFAKFITILPLGPKAVIPSAAFAAFFRMHLLEICLLLMSLFYFRNALGRCDWEHVRYSSGIPYILFCYLIVNYWLEAALEKRPKIAMILERSAFCLVVAAFLGGACRIGSQHLLTRDFPLQVADAEFIPSDYQEALAFIKANMSRGDQFLTLTSEPVWYYMLNQPCPTRFPIVWYGEPPFYQQEIVQELKAHNVKIILYANRSEYGNLDGISASERLPIVYAYIHNNYRPYDSIAGMEFWIRKS